MSQNLNQQAPTPNAGDVVFSPEAILAAQVYTSESPALVAGQAVKLRSDSTQNNIVITKAAATDPCFGFISSDLRTNTFAAKAKVGLWKQGAIIWVPVDEAVTPGARLMVGTTAGRLKIATAGNMAIALCVIGQATVGGLAQVQIVAPYALETVEGVSGYSSAL